MSPAELLEILSWVLPPLLGAAIGFLTNAIAIRMLFRPLKAVHIFGLQLPLTPGVIPRQRAQLAESIGRMVHKNLITVETIDNHLQAENIKLGLLRNIASLSASILEKPVSELERGRLKLFYSSMEDFLNQALAKLFASPSFLELVQRGLHDIITSLGDTQIDTLVAKTNLREVLLSYALPFLTGDKIKFMLGRELKKWTSSKLQENTPLARIIPEGFVNVFTGIFRSFLPELLHSLFKWLRTQEMRYLMETQGRVLLKNILDKLNVMQKFFISVAQYDKTLDSKMPEIVEDTLCSLEEGARDPLAQATFIETIREGIIQWEETGFFDLFDNESLDVVEKIDLLLEKFFSFLGDKKTTASIINGIDDLIAANGSKTLNAILQADLGTDIAKLEDFAYQAVLRYLQSGKSATGLAQNAVKLLVGLLDNMQDASLARLFNIDTQFKARIDQFLLDKAYEVIELKLPELVEGFNIKAMVVNKINSLEIEEVEKLLLMVIEKHLKWINVFGALLGALIGFSQLLLRLL